MTGSLVFDSKGLAGRDAVKAARPEQALLAGGHINAQVPKDIAHVARRKMRLVNPFRG